MSAAVDTPAVTALNEALRLAEAGYKLTPVTITRAANGKKDAKFHGNGLTGKAFRGWRHESAWSNDPDQIRAWWVDFPDTSFAISCAVNGIEGPDLDVKPAGTNSKGEQIPATDAVAWWSSQGLPLSPLLQRTPSGGLHSIWRIRTDGLTLPQEAGKTFGRGVDTRNRAGLFFAAGGYVVGEPGHYEILGALPRLDELPETPLEVVELFAAHGEEERAERPTDGRIVIHDEQWQRAQVALALQAIREHDRATGSYRAKLQHAGLFLGRAVEQGFLDFDKAERQILDAHRSVWGPEIWPENRKDVRDALNDGPRLERWRVPVDPAPTNGHALNGSRLLRAPRSADDFFADEGEEQKTEAESGEEEADAAEHASEGMSEEEAAQYLKYQRDLADEKRRLRLRRQAAAELDAENRPPDPGPALTSLADLLAEPDDAEAYRIGQLWPAGGKVLLSAPQKSGKTTLVGNLIRSLADGARFLSRAAAPGEFRVAAAGFEVAPLDGRRIALFDFEMTRRKLRDWLRDQRIANVDAVHVELMRGRVWDVRDPQIRAEWARQLQALNVGIVVVDPVGPVLGSLGIDENDNSAVAAFLFALDALVRESGADELFVTHHTGHGAERARGASAFLGWPDASWTIVRDEMSTARAFKAEGRDVWVPETTLLYDGATRRLSLGEGDRTTARSAGHAEIMAGIVQESPGETLNGLKKLARDTEIGTKVQHAQDAVRAAEAAGLVHAHRGPNRARLHFPGLCGDTCHARDLPPVDPQ